MITREHKTAPPIGFFLQEQAQMDRWKKTEGINGEGIVKVGVRVRGGKLQAKFQKFDRVEDCNIVPYFY